MICTYDEHVERSAVCILTGTSCIGTYSYGDMEGVADHSQQQGDSSCS